MREPFARPSDIGRTVLFLGDGKSLMTADRMSVGAGGTAREARVWDAATGKELAHFRCYGDHGDVVLCADGRASRSPTTGTGPCASYKSPRARSWGA